MTAVLRGGKPGPRIALRADMDALPVTERSDLPFASKATSTFRGETVGVMHACGHDAHVSILMGVAEALASMKAELPGEILFVFQPAEEGPPDGEEGGAEEMLAQGIFERFKPQAVFGLHVFSTLNACLLYTSLVARRKRGVALPDQRRARIVQQVGGLGIIRLQGLQREQQRDRRIRGFEQVAGSQRTFRPGLRIGGILRLQGDWRQRPTQHLRELIAAADAHAAGALGHAGLGRRRRLRLAGRQGDRDGDNERPASAQTALRVANRAGLG